jgi:hypothetical protein
MLLPIPYADVPPDATAGSFGVAVQIDPSLQSGHTITIGFILEDESGRLSNQPTIELEELASKTSTMGNS